MTLPITGYLQQVEIVVGGTLPRAGFVQPVEISGGGGGVIFGAGTPNRVAKFTAANTIGDGLLDMSGTDITPTTDGNLVIGTSLLRFNSMVTSGGFLTYSPVGSAQPTSFLSNDRVAFGPGGATVINMALRAATKVFFFDDNAGGGSVRVGVTSGSLYLESEDGAGAAVSGAATGRIRYNNTAGAWQMSVQGGAYASIGTGTVTASGPPAATQLAVWTSATNITGNSNFTYNSATDTVVLDSAVGTAILTIGVVGSSYVQIGATAGTTNGLNLRDGYGIGSSSQRLLTLTAAALTLGATASSAQVAFNIGPTIVSAVGAQLRAIRVLASTTTISGVTNITTATGFNFTEIERPTYSNASIAVTNAATVYIANSPLASGGMSIANAYSLWVDDGLVRFDGAFLLSGGTTQYIESTDGSTAAVSGAATGRIRYNNSTATWQVSVQTGAYANIVTGSSGVTLDGAYDFGGSGAGRTITVDTGAVTLTGGGTTVGGFTQNGSRTIASAAGAIWDEHLIDADVSLSGTTNVTTATGFNMVTLNAPTITDAGTITSITNAATFYIGGAPAGSGLSVTNAYALWVDAGISRFDEQIFGMQGTTSAPSYAALSFAGYGFNISSTGVVSVLQNQNPILNATSTAVTIGSIPSTTATAAIDINPSTQTYGAGVSSDANAVKFTPNQVRYNMSAGTVANSHTYLFGIRQIKDISSVVITRSSTVYVQGTPGSNDGTATFTRKYALLVDSAGGSVSGPSTLVGISPETAYTSGALEYLRVVGVASTGQTASTEINFINLNLAQTVQWATGAITDERLMYVQASTLGFVGASTVTRATTFAIDGSPTQGTNATLTTSLAFWIAAGGTGSFNTYFGATPSMGGGIGVIGIANAGTNPSSNPTGGGILYSNAGAGTWRGSGGTVTAFGPAGPHCERCGYDEWTVATLNTVWKSWRFECGHCGATYAGGPRDVRDRLPDEHRKKTIRQSMKYEDVEKLVA